MPMEYFCMDDHFPGIFDSLHSGRRFTSRLTWVSRVKKVIQQFCWLITVQVTKAKKYFLKRTNRKVQPFDWEKKIRRQVFFASNKPENHTTERKRKKWKERGERKEENKKSCAYTLAFERENKHCLINQSIFIPPNITRYILSYISSCKSKNT